MNDLVVPEASLVRIRQEIVRYGRRRNETGGFFLGTPGSCNVSVVALAGTKGIHRTNGLFRISEKAILTLFEWVEDSGLQILAQVHSHERSAFLSETDRRFGFSVEGFRSAVIPNYLTPPLSAVDWGWWRYENASWTDIDPPHINTGSVSFVRFDEKGVKCFQSREY